MTAAFSPISTDASNEMTRCASNNFAEVIYFVFSVANRNEMREIREFVLKFAQQNDIQYSHDPIRR